MLWSELTLDPSLIGASGYYGLSGLLNMSFLSHVLIASQGKIQFFHRTTYRFTVLTLRLPFGLQFVMPGTHESSCRINETLTRQLLNLTLQSYLLFDYLSRLA